MKLITLSLLLCASIFVSCNKDDDDGGSNTTDTPSTINISTPGANAIYTNGATLRVEGDMTDMNGLSSARLEVRNRTSGAILHQQSLTTGGVTFFRYVFNWTITGISTLTPATVKVTAVDRSSRLVSKEVDIQLDN